MIGIGCDIVEIERMQKACQNNHFVERVFTEVEIAYCQNKGKQAYASYAARFAAKEAVLKALGTGLRGGEIKEIEVIVDNLGKPSINLYGYHAKLAEDLGVKQICVSLSHGREHAIAYVTME